MIASDEPLVRNLPKTIWLILVIFIPTVGAIAWLILGRPQGVQYSPGSTSYRTPRGPVGPEDSPTFMSALDERKRLQKWEEELRRREEKLGRDEDDGKQKEQ